MKKKVLLSVLIIGLGVSLGLLAQGLTADQILNRVEEAGGFVGGGAGSIITTAQVDITPDGEETTSYTFRVYTIWDVEGEPDRGLLVYLAPELVAGTMLLSWTPVVGDARIWLHLPALGLTKELIAPAIRGEEFVVGSGISREELAAGFRFRDDYSPELVGEETVQGKDCYVLVLTPLEGHFPDWSSITLWVDKEHFVVVQVEFYDEEGNLARIMEGADFYADQIGYIPRKIMLTNLALGSTVTISILARALRELPPEYFDPKNLPPFELEGL